MFSMSRTALIAIGLAAALAGSFAPATAAPGETCYFGECRSSTTPAALPAPSRPEEPRVVARQGSWTAVAVGKGAMIVDEFTNGAKFAVLIYPDGKLGLRLSQPNWEFKPGQEVQMTFEVDGDGFRGTATVNEKGMLEVEGVNKRVLETLYRGRRALINAGGYRFEMSKLADAAAVIDAVVQYQQTASR
jgi:hypothetical protein